MARKEWLSLLRSFAGYSVLFLLGYIKGGVTLGLAFSMSFVAAHLNEFYLLRAIIKLVKGAKPAAFEYVAGGCGLVTSVALVSSGFGMLFALSTAAHFIVDAVLLRFR